MRHRLFALCLTSLWGMQAAMAADEPVDGESIEEIEVTGERAGPRLWRVSNGEHVVWLLGTLDPLPRQMSWRSQELVAVLGEVKQVVPSEPDVDVEAGPITLMRTYFQWRRVRTLPEGQTLQNWLTPQQHARWVALKKRYDMRDKTIDRQLPMLAALRLYRRALDVSKLASGTGIERSVVKLARKHKVAVRQTHLEVDDPRGLVKQVGEIPREAQVACLESVMERLEKDLDTIKAQANAWSLGDVDTLRALPYPREIRECQNALENSGDMKRIIADANAAWIGAVDRSLVSGPPTLAVRPIYELLKSDGTLAALRAKGYRVEGP
jgi:uncharacterized protein YbaP (TraB family)